MVSPHVDTEDKRQSLFEEGCEQLIPQDVPPVEKLSLAQNSSGDVQPPAISDDLLVM